MPTPEIEELRRILARRLQDKAELEQQVRAVQSRLEAEVAPLQEEVLRLQMERLKAAAQARMRSARLRNAYHDAQEAYEAFRERRAAAPPASASTKTDLKATYRRATKRCHPDAVPDAYREEAAATFRALESAYDADDAEAVRAIAADLDEWGFPRAPSDEGGGQDASALHRAVSRLGTEIERLRASDAHRAVAEAGEADVEAVVQARKHALKERLWALQHRRQARF